MAWPSSHPYEAVRLWAFSTFNQKPTISLYPGETDFSKWRRWTLKFDTNRTVTVGNAPLRPGYSYDEKGGAGVALQDYLTWSGTDSNPLILPDSHDQFSSGPTAFKPRLVDPFWIGTWLFTLDEDLRDRPEDSSAPRNFYINDKADSSFTNSRRKYKLERADSLLCTQASLATGRPLDSVELALLNRFRSGYLRERPSGRALLRQYYRVAPRLIKMLEPLGRPYWAQVYQDLLEPTCRLVRQNRGHEALVHYIGQVKKAQDLATTLRAFPAKPNRVPCWRYNRRRYPS
jgi:hypothetical protein